MHSAPGTSGTYPSGPVSQARLASLVPPRANPASWPIVARFQSFYCKVSQNHRVSPKSVEKAYHSPYFQNGSQKSPLEKLRFPFLLAFSHKELLGPF